MHYLGSKSLGPSKYPGAKDTAVLMIAAEEYF